MTMNRDRSVGQSVTSGLGVSYELVSSGLGVSGELTSPPSLNYSAEANAVVNKEIKTPSQGDIEKEIYSKKSGERLALRPYQHSAVGELRGWLAAGELRLMLASPTGSGKTEMGMEVVRGVVRKGKRVAFLCNRIHLVTQTSRRFAKAGIAHGVIQGSNTRGVYERVLVASIQTAAKRGMPPVDVLVIDEAHGTAGSAAYREVISKHKGPVIGLSATPFSKGLGKHYDDLDGPLFQRMVVAATIVELIDAGYLVDCDVYAPSAPDMSGVKTQRNSFGESDWSDADVSAASDKPELIGDIVEHWHKLAGDTPTVCFASGIPHSKHIVEQFVRAGVRAEHIDCYTPDDERAAILARVASGQTRVISNVGILCEGWDFPACKTLILARPTKSLIRYLQMVGRVLRPHPGKEKALVLDHSGTVLRLGLPTDEHPMELDDGKPKAGSDDKRKRRESLPKACPACHYMRPAKVHCCPACGFAPERRNTVQTRDGSLQKLVRGMKGESPSATREQKQIFFSELVSIRAERGYGTGWVAHTYRAKFGVWPQGLSDVPMDPSRATLNFVKGQLIRHAKSHVNRN